MVSGTSILDKPGSKVSRQVRVVDPWAYLETWGKQTTMDWDCHKLKPVIYTHWLSR